MTRWLLAATLAFAACAPAVRDTPSPTVALDRAACEGDATCVGRASVDAPAGPQRCKEPPCDDPAWRCTGAVLAAGGVECGVALTPEEQHALDARVERAQRRVLDGQYADAGALADLARLQLLRHGHAGDADGDDDTMRAKKNAQRAIAVDDTSAAGRLALALALARSFEVAASLVAPRPRALALHLVDEALAAVPSADPAVEAGALTLRGYLALAEGTLDAALVAFERATFLAPTQASAWLGRGDAERAARRFDDAERAYGRAGALAAAVRGQEAASAHRALPLPQPLPALPRGAVGRMGSSAPPAPCPPDALLHAQAAALCQGRASLVAAGTDRDRLRRAATEIVDAFRALRDLCENGDPACGTWVAAGLVEAADAFAAAGAMAKAIMVDRMLQDPRYGLPGVDALAPRAELAIADDYHALGIFDEAARHYARYTSLAGLAASAGARERALRLALALGDVELATANAATVVRDRGIGDDTRATWLLATAWLLRVARSPEAAAAWLDPHRQLIVAAGLGVELDAVVAPRGGQDEAGGVPLLARGVRFVAAEEAWSARPGG